MVEFENYCSFYTKSKDGYIPPCYVLLSANILAPLSLWERLQAINHHVLWWQGPRFMTATEINHLSSEEKIFFPNIWSRYVPRLSF